MAKALVVYASWTGNSEYMAEELGEELKKLGVETEVYECQQIDPEAFLKADICVISTYTWGVGGDLPDEMKDFYLIMGDLDLSGKIFGTMGSGEAHYGFYCRAVETFEKLFEARGAVKGADMVMVEGTPGIADMENIKEMAKQLAEFRV